jgi:hypothetical protein
MKPSDYGKYFWCIGLCDEARSKIHAYADQVEISPNGSVVLRGPNNLINLAFQAGQWAFVYASSASDAGAVAVERWPGEVPGQQQGLPSEPPSPDARTD